MSSADLSASASITFAMTSQRHRGGAAPIWWAVRIRPISSRPVDGACVVICRFWRGWTTPENASAYEAIVREEVIPEIEARRIPGLRSIDLMRRPVEEGVEFATMMWFDDLEAVRAFVGEDYEVAHVPERARKVLSRFDRRSAHFEVIDRRNQSAS